MFQQNVLARSSKVWCVIFGTPKNIPILERSPLWQKKKTFRSFRYIYANYSIFSPLCFLKMRPLYFSPNRMSKPFIFPPQEVFNNFWENWWVIRIFFLLEKLTFPQNRSIILLFDFTNKRMTTYLKLYVINLHYV